MQFDTGKAFGVVEVDYVFTNEKGMLVGVKDENTDHTVKYMRCRSGTWAKTETVEVVKRTPEQAAFAMKTIQNVCAQALARLAELERNGERLPGA